MPDQKITDLVDGGAPQATDEFVIARAGDNFKIDYASLETEALTDAVIINPASSARNVIIPTAGTVIDLIVKAHAAQSVDLFRVEAAAGAGLGYFRVGATGAVGMGNGTYDPALYGGWQPQLVLSRATDGFYDPLGGPNFTPDATGFISGLFLDFNIVPTADGYANGTDHYGMGASVRLGGDKSAFQLRGSYNEAVLTGIKAPGTPQVERLTGGEFVGTLDSSSTGDVTYVTGVRGLATHAGDGTASLVRGVWANGRAENGSPVTLLIGLDAVVDCDGTTPTLPELIAIRAGHIIAGSRTVTLSKGIHVDNMGDAQVGTSYGLYMDAQSGSTNVYGLYVAGGKSVFVDTLIHGKVAAPADGDLAASQAAWWFDNTNGSPKWMSKGKTADGTVVTFTLPWVTPYAPGGTDVAVADGGTGASTAAGARTNLDVPSNAEAILDAIVDAKGDLIAGTAADTVARVAVGTNGYALIADSVATPGMRWAASSLEEILAEGLGFLSWNFPIGEVDGGGTSASQQVSAMIVPVRANVAITNIHVWVTTQGATVTSCKCGLLDTAGANLRLTADLGTAWETTGLKTHALTSTYTPSADGVIYVAFWHVASTAAQFARQTANTNSVALAGRPLAVTRQTGQGTFPSPATLATFNNQYFVAIS